MRILAIEDEPTTEKGGSERSYFDVLTGLQARGHEVTLLYRQPGNLLDSYVKAGVRMLQIQNELLLRPPNKVREFLVMYSTAKMVRLQGPFDIIYLNFSEALPMAFLLKHFTGARIVCHLRVPYFGLSRQIRWAGRAVMAFIVINKKLKPAFENAFKAKGKVSVVYNGLSIPARLSEPMEPSRDTELKLLYLGRIAPDKGVIEMVHALATAINRGVKATLQITGSYLASHLRDYKSELEEAIRKTGIGHLITISGPVPEPVDYISKFDLFIFPSVWEEPFGRTIGEAILAGIPVLARNVGMVSEIMADNPAFIFDTDDSLVARLEQYFHGNIVFETGKARDRIIRDFNKTRMIDEVEKKLMESVKNN